MPASHSYPLVSIILPTYNRAALIPETIASVLGQSYSNWELLVIDDSSTDNTTELVAAIPDDRIKLYNTPSRIGITATREEGLRHARGELLAFLDSDDLWDDSKIEKQVEAMEKFSGAGFCLTGGYNFREPGKPLEFFYKQNEGSKYEDLLVPFFRGEVAATTPSLLFRRECLDTVGFASHVEFILRLASHFPGIILYEPLLFRRLHATNRSGEDWTRGEKDGLRLFRIYGPLLPGGVRKDAFFRFYINSGEKYLRHGQRGKAIGRFLKAWSFRPLSGIPIKKTGKAVLNLLGRK